MPRTLTNYQKEERQDSALLFLLTYDGPVTLVIVMLPL